MCETCEKLGFVIETCGLRPTHASSYCCKSTVLVPARVIQVLVSLAAHGLIGMFLAPKIS